jgi:hypothetical protein
VSFSLDKWYMDVVADDGEALVLYAAELRLFGLHLHYASIVQHRAGGTRAMSTLRRSMPELEGKTLRWSSRALGVGAATWVADGEGVNEPLLGKEATAPQGDDGTVVWSCHMPLARAEVELDGGRVVRGLGYADELTLTMAPWALPIDELRWGRFTGEGASVVWLDWRGAHEKRVILKHGARVRGTVGDRMIEMPEDEAKVTIAEGTVLREGPLGTGPLAAVAELHALLPHKILATVERQVLARATLEQPFSAPVRGWAISEVVRWG